jgi:hypothetical protein
MTKFGFERLFSGDLPLWNPFQLCGLPFLAIPHVGLLYPGNWIYGLMETAAATEASFVLHLFLAGAGMFLLVRTLEMPRVAALAASLTFMWSGWMIFYANQASLISGMSWLPVTVWMVEQSFRGRRSAPFLLAISVAFQLLNGATEFFVQNMYVAGGYSLLRLGQLAAAGDWRIAARTGAVLLGAVVAGVLLATPQLLPSMELAGESVRGAQPLRFHEARRLGAMAPPLFFLHALMTTGIVTVGALPLVGLALGAGTRQRGLWAFCVLVSVVAVLLVFGGDFYRFYFTHTPFGGLFRRPHKFLHIFAFVQALITALGFLWLLSNRERERSELWRTPVFVIACALPIVAMMWLASRDHWNPYWLLLLALLLGFVALRGARARGAIVIGLLALQATCLFLGPAQQKMRPFLQRERFHVHDETLERVRAAAGDDRVFIGPDIRFLPGLMPKSGMLHGIRVVGGYEPLVSLRAAKFFDRAARSLKRGDPFAGSIRLDEDSNWAMMDLTGARIYVVRAGSNADLALARDAARGKKTGVRLLSRGFPNVYERVSALPRAWVVGRAVYVDTPESALDVVAGSDFDPHRQVVLEAPAPSGPAAADVRGLARVVVDDRERIELEVSSSGPGYLVLADAYFPGWRVSVDGEERPLHRANHLFRAVPLEAGESRVVFEYVPRAFRVGLAASGVTALVLLIVGWRWVWVGGAVRR